MAAIAGTYTITRRRAAQHLWSLRQCGKSRLTAARLAVSAFFSSRSKRTIEIDVTGPHEVSAQTATFHITAR